MIKKIKKLLIVLSFILAIIMLKSTYVFAKTDIKLESNINDVKTMVIMDDGKVEVLLENGELWSVDNKTNKFSKRLSTNVKDYKYSYVDYVGISGENPNNGVIQKLKENNNLYAKNADNELKISDVKQINKYGFLKKDGTYYIYTLNNEKFGYKKILTKVDSLIGDFLCIKEGKTYDIYGNKIFDFTLKQDFSFEGQVVCMRQGIALDQKGNLWKYFLEYEDKSLEILEKTTEKLKSNVKQILGPNQYLDTSDNVKYIIDEFYEEENYIESDYLATGNGEEGLINILGLKENGELHLNGKCIVDNVAKIYPLYYTNKSFFIRKDGSIWKIEIEEKVKLTKVRSGNMSAKKISKPTNVKATKSGSKNIKLSWSKVDGASKYTVYRATSKNGSYKKIGTTKSGSYTDKKATVGKTYYYKIVANHSNSDYSSSRTSAVKMKIPKAPTSLKVSKKSKTSMKVSYKKSSGVTGYEVKYSTSKNFKDSKTKDLKGTSVTIKSLKKKKTYYVKVRAYQTINGKKVYSSYTKTVKVSLK